MARPVFQPVVLCAGFGRRSWPLLRKAIRHGTYTGLVRRRHNPGKAALESIEVQSGSYLGEDNIDRFVDDQERVMLIPECAKKDA